MAIRNQDAPALDVIEGLEKDILAKAFTILGELAQLPKSGELVELKADIIAAFPAVPADVVRESFLTTTKNAILAAITAARDYVVSQVGTKVDAATATLAGNQAALAANQAALLANQGTMLGNQATNSGTLSGLIATARDYVISQLSALIVANALPPRTIIDVALSASGQVPAGFEMVSGLASLPQEGLLPFFLRAGSSIAAGTTGSNWVQTPDLKIHYLVGSSGTTHTTFIPDQGLNGSALAYPTAYTNNAALCVLASGRIYAAGGSNGTTTNTTAYTYGGGPPAWTAVAPLPVARAAFPTVLLNDGRVLSIGGVTASATTTTFNAAGITDICALFDENTNTCVAAASTPIRGAQAQAVKLPSGKVIWVPRTTSDGTTISTTAASLARAFIYDPALNSWAETDPLPDSGSFASYSLMVPEATGALILHAAAGSGAKRFIEANAPGSKWVNIEQVFTGATLGGNISPLRGGIGLRLTNGLVLCPQSSFNGMFMVAIQYAPLNTIVQARKL